MTLLSFQINIKELTLICGLYNWILLEDAYRWRFCNIYIKGSPQALTQESYWGTSWHISCTKNSFSWCVNQYITSSWTLTSVMNLRKTIAVQSCEKCMVLRPGCTQDVWAPPITWHLFSPELGGHVEVGIAMQHGDAFSEFIHTAENQLNAMQWVMLRHLAHSLNLSMDHWRKPSNIHHTWSAEDCDKVTLVAAQGIVWIRGMLSCAQMGLLSEFLRMFVWLFSYHHPWASWTSSHLSVSHTSHFATWKWERNTPNNNSYICYRLPSEFWRVLT